MIELQKNFMTRRKHNYAFGTITLIVMACQSFMGFSVASLGL
jgi:hypothetical protein